MTQNNTWYKESIPSILQFFGTSERGLDEAEASRRLKKYGPNKLAEQATESLLAIFLRQFQSPLIYVLILASAIVFYLGETADGVIILIVLLFNSLVGTIQEGRAQNTLLALKKFVTTQATVLREEKELILSDIEVVPGDIIVLQEGEKIAADARVLISRGLKVDEAAMTGESNAVHKVADASIEAPTLPAEQKNMVFKGTHVVAGNGKAVVVATGSDTAIGHIAREIATIDTEIPLKTNIRYLSRVVIITVAGICSLLFLIGLIMGNTAAEMFAVSVSLAVSIIPEGLPIVVTLILATGVRRMSKCNALVKKLQAVEALGQARVIAVDKTGTITKNQMVIQKIYTDKKM